MLRVLQFLDLERLVLSEELFRKSKHGSTMSFYHTKKAFLDRASWLNVATALSSLMLQVICKVGEKSLWQMYTEVPDIPPVLCQESLIRLAC